MRPYLLWCCFGFLFISCDYFNSHEDRVQAIYMAEMELIEFDEVDKFPYFEECQETASKLEDYECFVTNMSLRLAEPLQGLKFKVTEDMDEIVYVDLIVDEQGFVEFEEIKENPRVNELIPELNEEVRRRIRQLTAQGELTVHPALKRDIPVRIKVRLPIILKTS